MGKDSNKVSRLRNQAENFRNGKTKTWAIPQDCQQQHLQNRLTQPKTSLWACATLGNQTQSSHNSSLPWDSSAHPPGITYATVTPQHMPIYEPCSVLIFVFLLKTQQWGTQKFPEPTAASPTSFQLSTLPPPPFPLDLSEACSRGLHALVMITDGSGQGPDTNPRAGQMHQFAQPAFEAERKRNHFIVLSWVLLKNTMKASMRWSQQQPGFRCTQEWFLPSRSCVVY